MIQYTTEIEKYHLKSELKKFLKSLNLVSVKYYMANTLSGSPSKISNLTLTLKRLCENAS